MKEECIMNINIVNSSHFLDKMKDPDRNPLSDIREKQRRDFNPYRSVERLMNLGSDRSYILDSMVHSDDEEYSTYLKIITNLLKKGVVGYEYLEVNNRPYKSFITTSIGNHKLSGAKPYRRENHTIYA